MKILKKEILVSAPEARIILMQLACPDISRKALPGQFVVLMVSEEGERIPLTVVDKDAVQGSITIIFQEAGLTTRLLGRLEAGDSLYAVAGPLGHPTEIRKFGRVALVGGGVGIAEIYPVARAMKEAGNHVIAILGARTKGLLILEDELKGASSELFVTTDDGSYARKGFTTDVLSEVLDSQPCDLVYAVGPIPMMKRVSQVAAARNTKVIVSLNALMVDATGMCGCCRVSVAGKTRFSCVDGPEFEGSLVDWEELSRRNRIYTEKEQHICRLNNLT